MLLLLRRRSTRNIHRNAPLAIVALLPDRGVAAGESVFPLAARERPARVAQIAALGDLGRLGGPAQLEGWIGQRFCPVSLDRVCRFCRGFHRGRVPLD